jgi:hypothetical protein
MKLTANSLSPTALPSLVDVRRAVQDAEAAHDAGRSTTREIAHHFFGHAIRELGASFESILNALKRRETKQVVAPLDAYIRGLEPSGDDDAANAKAA